MTVSPQILSQLGWLFPVLTQELTLIIGGKVSDESLIDISGWKKLLSNISKVIVVGEPVSFSPRILIQKI